MLQRSSSLRIVALVALALFAALLYLSSTQYRVWTQHTFAGQDREKDSVASPHVEPESHASFSRVQQWLPPKRYERPANVSIIGLIFYGRARNLEILDCYLQRNLALNGGWLDEIFFVENTQVVQDVTWLHQRVAQVPQYKIKTHPFGQQDYNEMWRYVVQAGAIHVKIDDDMIFMSDKAVEEVVTTLIARPDAYAVLANLVNSASLGWVHHHSEAVLPYMPEPVPPPRHSSASYGPTAWRASALPTYPLSGQAFDKVDLALDHQGDITGPPGEPGAAPFANHRCECASSI